MISIFQRVRNLEGFAQAHDAACSERHRSINDHFARQDEGLRDLKHDTAKGFSGVRSAIEQNNAEHRTERERLVGEMQTRFERVLAQQRVTVRWAVGFGVSVTLTLLGLALRMVT